MFTSMQKATAEAIAQLMDAPAIASTAPQMASVSQNACSVASKLEPAYGQSIVQKPTTSDQRRADGTEQCNRPKMKNIRTTTPAAKGTDVMANANCRASSEPRPSRLANMT